MSLHMMPGGNIPKEMYRASSLHHHHSLPHGLCDKSVPTSHFCMISTFPSKFSHLVLNHNKVLFQVKNPLMISNLPQQEFFLREHCAVHPKIFRCGTDFCFSVVLKIEKIIISWSMSYAVGNGHIVQSVTSWSPSKQSITFKGFCLHNSQ